VKDQSKPQQKGSNHKAKIHRVKRIGGQVRGIEKMIVEQKYCPNIITQIRAAKAALASLEAAILEGHFEHCVRNAMQSRSTTAQNRTMKELMELFKRG
jgi:DNA-binding FrmR family transcriptional regulator